MIEIAAYLLKILGVAFLLVAAIGVLRLPDAFTRMHAATKAGTLGAGLVVMGSALSLTGPEAIGLAVIVAIVLLATVPLASHLLARAAYTSGAPFWAGTARDALAGRLRRGDAAGDETGEAPTEAAAPHPIARIVVAPTHGARGQALAMARDLAATLGVPLAVMGLVDGRRLDAGRHAEARRRLEAVLARVTGGQTPGPAPSIAIDEGAPEEILRAARRDGDLVVLPPVGWFDHGAAGMAAANVDPAGDPRTGRPDNPLPLAHALARPVLLAGETPRVGRVVVLDDEGPEIVRAVATLAALRPFGAVRVRATWAPGTEMTTERRVLLSAAAEGLDFGFQAPTNAEALVRDPGDLLVCRHVPGAARGDWYGTDWRDRLAPGWRGAVLLV